jgi:hypothetical protein
MSLIVAQMQEQRTIVALPASANRAYRPSEALRIHAIKVGWEIIKNIFKKLLTRDLNGLTVGSGSKRLSLARTEESPEPEGGQPQNSP